MNLYEENKQIRIEGLEDFNLMQTLECGQCFRYTKIKDNKYFIVAKHRLLEIEQTPDSIILFNTTLSDYNQIWKDYFDFNTDYSEIKHYLITKDAKMKDIIKNGDGIRILNQDFVEILISFIISQNKQIPQIKQVVENLCSRYGDFIVEYNDVKYYDFPSVQKLSTLSEENFRECKAGFRAKYLVDACLKLANGSINEADFETLTSSEIQDILCTIKGVGVKVSNCVLLYGLKQKEAFPIDVWIKRIMENIYFKEDTKIEQIQNFADELFGKYGGYAQQYLFYYSRNIDGFTSPAN